MNVTLFVFILFSALICMYYAESCDKAKFNEWENTRKKFSNPYDKK